MDDWEGIWRGLQRGDPHAFEAVLNRLARSVWLALRRMTGRDDLADELFGRTWLRFVETADRIQSPQAIRAYVLSIARRQWLDELARMGRHASLVDAQAETIEGIDASQGANDAATALEILAQAEQTERLRQAVGKLPEPLREVVVLRTYGELKFREIAEVLDLPIGTVLTRMRSATSRLTEMMTREPDGERHEDVLDERPR